METTSGPASLHSPMPNKGGSWSYTFTTAGTYGYVCTVHPGMTARIVVTAAACERLPHRVHHPLDPLLVLAGVIAGVAVLCLLLVGSRSAAATATPSDDAKQS
ncbi:cupredoxin domain-containing protein [Streptomyces sp. 3214.6]|uniref:cupredoxin domain-containing protein n=1 Tax=Streptomyces sp. 3214.6 TaxID=1882757 RepID=UPI001E391B48|nr:plastocyanin/azurin family copper-binding protein [Streptomyces sp. 3214.6]